MLITNTKSYLGVKKCETFWPDWCFYTMAHDHWNNFITYFFSWLCAVPDQHMQNFKRQNCFFL